MELLFPPIYLLQAHLSTEELHDLEDKIPTLTYDIKEAKVVLGKISQKRRAVLELTSRGVHTKEVVAGDIVEEILQEQPYEEDEHNGSRPHKRRKVEATLRPEEVITIDSSTESEDDGVSYPRQSTNNSTGNADHTHFHHQTLPPSEGHSSPLGPESQHSPGTTALGTISSNRKDTIKIAKLSWFTDSAVAGKLLPLDKYIIYEGRLVEKSKSPDLPNPPRIVTKVQEQGENILIRARNDDPKSGSTPYRGYVKHGRTGQNSQPSQTRPTHLLHQTTSEHDDPKRFPPVPLWLRNTYSCTRPTPLTSPNDPFLSELKKIKLWRKLTNDEIGVRAYSTAIASIAAYPYKLVSPSELARLPGCGGKISLLYDEWCNGGHVKEADDIEGSEKFQTLNLFYEIWGCAAMTANEFYGKGYKDLDDIVEHEWSRLSRVQQIGVKFYEEFQDKIPRAEVETIADKILEHANKLQSGFQMCIVGGYRRGKTASGDVDVVLTHPDEEVTADFIDQIVGSLEHSGWVSHLLIVTHANSERGQTPVSWKGDLKKAGTGFDTLDKALLVWQDPHWPTEKQDLKDDPGMKNPNVHRRVDIIISPWKTAGCAILGWTSGTTFNRDMRRWANKVKNLKFDSSGVRSREDGRWVDLESEGEDTSDLVEKEKRVFRALGLEWREPTMRCTG